MVFAGESGGGVTFSTAHGVFSRHLAALLLITTMLAALFAPGSLAQDSKPGVIGYGDLVVSGASGTVPPQGQLPAGVSETDETFIDTNGASIRVFDVTSPDGPPSAQILNAPTKLEVGAGNIGQVFGLALDDNDPPNIYATATSVHGLHIVVPDADGDGRPERIKVGQPGAQWMEGQFGTANGGSPGSIYKINGETGELSLFADISNSGPGLGNIAYDPRTKQLFVSDLDSGLVHQFDMEGNDLGAFDHGLQGRPANGMEAVQDDGAQADITNPSFDAEDSGTWGLTAPERRVWGLGVYKDRLYYGVEEGPQIWSVGINQDGSFGADPRWELDVPADPDALPVSDIVFQSNGLMYLAQRGGISSRYDYSRYHTPRKSGVLRYRLESPDDPNTPSRWVGEPEDYAIGFPGNHRNASGGVALGYGYKDSPDGGLGFGSCEGTLWSTGDALRDNPVHAARLADGGPLNVHGLQGNALDLVRPKNVPPFDSYYVDFDGQFEDPQASGHVGDVEIPRKCGGKRTNVMDLRIFKRAAPERCAGGAECPFAIEVTNTGNLTYEGPLIVEDVAHNGAVLATAAPPDWNCKEHFAGIGIYVCEHPGVTLAPGESTTLELTFTTPGYWDRPVYNNCAELLVPGTGVDQRPYNNRSCDYVASGGPGVTPEPDLQIEKYGRYGACDFFGLCEFSVIITNVGGAPYTGQLHVNDIATTPGATMVDWSPKPDWNCAATGPDSYGCSTAGPVTLTPGDYRELIILVQGPPFAPGFTHVRNCASIDWNGAQQDYNPHNEYACAAISSLPPDHPDARPVVRIEKESPGYCSRAAAGSPWYCFYRVIVTNDGAAPLEGEIEFTDELSPHNATLASYGGSPGPWTCNPGVGNTGPFTCTHPAIAGGLVPGDRVRLSMYVRINAGVAAPSFEVNCAKTNFDNDGDGADEELEGCRIALICDAGSANCPKDLVVKKWNTTSSCPRGTDCTYDLSLKNLGNAAVAAPLTIIDVPAAGAGPLTASGGGWSCAPAGGSYTCTNPAALPAGATSYFSVSTPIPAGYAQNTAENCAEIAPSADNTLAFNDKDCGTASVPQVLPADLAPFSETTCYRGQTCQLPGRIDNLGEQTFTGFAGVNGTLSPGLEITALESNDLDCAIKEGATSYECARRSLTIRPGKSANYTLTVTVPEDYPHSQVNHIKTMVWPDEKVRDKNSKNDQHTSIIKIIDPPQAAGTKPPPPPPPAGKPDLAISKTASQPTCNANLNCNFLVTLSNTGKAAYSGGVTIKDTITPGTTRYVGTNPRGWNCTGNRGGVTCTKPDLNLAPGASDSIYLAFAVPRYGSGTANNCATVIRGVASAPRSGNTVRDIQAALAAQGYYKGSIDGKTGPQTSTAIREYQRLYNMAQTGQIDAALENRLLGASGGSAGGEDSNPNNNRACASVNIQGEAPPPPPPQCTGGQYLSSHGQCACPSSRQVWTGSQCISRPPQQCSGGRIRNHQGQCVCPADKPNWSGSFCFAKEIITPPPPQQCSGGRFQNNRGQCVCPPNAPVWTGVICIPTIQVCTGGRQLVNGQCKCPVSLPIWNGKSCGGIQGPKCSGGQYPDRSGKCVCPSSNPVWNGQTCIGRGHGGTPPPTNPPGHGGIKPLPSPACSGGRIRQNGSCTCPSSKPVFIGGQCRSLPGGIKLPGVR